MLKEYYDDARKSIDELIKLELTKLVAAEGNSRHDLIRGRIGGFKDALDVLRSTLESFSGNDSDLAPLASANQERVERQRVYRGGRA